MDNEKIVTILVTAFGTYLANLGLEWAKHFFNGKDKRQETNASVVVKQIDLSSEEREQIHEWWQQQVSENKGLLERATKAEAEMIVLGSERDKWKERAEEALKRAEAATLEASRYHRLREGFDDLMFYARDLKQKFHSLARLAESKPEYVMTRLAEVSAEEEPFKEIETRTAITPIVTPDKATN